jgi:hypothetical protein
MTRRKRKKMYARPKRASSTAHRQGTLLPNHQRSPSTSTAFPQIIAINPSVNRTSEDYADVTASLPPAAAERASCRLALRSAEFVRRRKEGPIAHVNA